MMNASWKGLKSHCGIDIKQLLPLMEELVKHLSLFRYSNAITNMPVRRYSNFSVYFSQNSWFVGYLRCKYYCMSTRFELVPFQLQGITFCKCTIYQYFLKRKFWAHYIYIYNSCYSLMLWIGVILVVVLQANHHKQRCPIFVEFPFVALLMPFLRYNVLTLNISCILVHIIEAKKLYPQLYLDYIKQGITLQ